ncbi:MAG TPA: nicotinate-nucleotide adenylyltransferase [Phycisphaerae bacterium]|nr:nicotinate-nucleotide adenylyltransferase [Phycisphaerae bacterium]HOJ76242.1 nicotinate-nucleotide adenylyltransferase [Phycisphaerae bacterium]HOM53546.1 nicotinate-nucleotide adenylyltransferase [Phycisphaerae bacterium]HON66357.1 nicotinate-nucleotide adenylyltransferase [Phycisphaerae bacterium]HPP28866.1 nicotinate-nucleotide adenylyltransferase [Phycisphaerae bacterium]
MGNGIALFGGTFDPIHHGHLIVARAVVEQLGYARVVLIPAPNPPHKVGRELTDATHRLEMARRAVEGEPRFDVSDIELRRPGLSYTILTVEAFRREVGPDVPLAWIIGGDSLPELHSWYRIGELVDACRIVTAVRAGYETPDLSALRRTLAPEQVDRLCRDILPTPVIEISATDIRRRVHDGESIRYLVPESVRAYIHDHNLYK